MDPNTVYRYASVDAWRLETHCNDIAAVATWIRRKIKIAFNCLTPYTLVDSWRTGPPTIAWGTQVRNERINAKKGMR